MHDFRNKKNKSTFNVVTSKTEQNKIQMLRRSLSCGSITYDHDSEKSNNYLSKNNLDRSNHNGCSIRRWFLADVKKQIESSTLPIQSFNHVSREVLNLQKSLDFYINILGFQEVPRPAFEVEGHWLWGYGLSLHLILTKRKQERMELLKKRLEHFTDCLPSVDHIAFVTNDLHRIGKLIINSLFINMATYS